MVPVIDHLIRGPGAASCAGEAVQHVDTVAGDGVRVLRCRPSLRHPAGHRCSGGVGLHLRRHSRHLQRLRGGAPLTLREVTEINGKLKWNLHIHIYLSHTYRHHLSHLSFDTYNSVNIVCVTNTNTHIYIYESQKKCYAGLFCSLVRPFRPLSRD